MKKSTSPTMEDIARIAGVSRATVSRALKNNELISKDTRDKIQQIARDLNYEVNVAARNFRLKKTGTLAVVLLVDKEWGHELSNAFLMALLGCIADEASHAGYDLLLATDLKRIQDLHSHFIESKRADGIIVIGQGRNDPRLERLVEMQAPFVVWGAPVERLDYPVVGSDNTGGAFLATTRLLETGRKHIAFMGDTRHPEVADRYTGYCRALEAAGMMVQDDLVIPVDFSRSDGYEKTARYLIDRPDPVDAIFAVSDSIAIGAMKKLREAQLSIPSDVAIVGFDDSPISTYSSPALTTVRQDTRTGGRKLVQNLLTVLAGEPVQSLALPTELVIRQSA